MSDQTTLSDHNKYEVPAKCLQSSQSVWISHWTHTRLRSVDDTHIQSTHSHASGSNIHRYEQGTSLSGPETEPHSSKFEKEFREIHKALIKEGSTTSWKSLKPETSKIQHFPMFKSSENRERDFSLNNGESSIHQEEVSRSKIGPVSGYDVSLGPSEKFLHSMLSRTPSKPGIQSTKSLLDPEGIASNPEQQLKSNALLEKNRVVLGHAKYELLGSTSAVFPLEFNSNTPTEFFSFKQDCINQTNSNFLVHGGKVDKNASLLTHDPSTTDDRLRGFLGGQLQNVPNCGLNPIKLPEAALYHGSYEAPRNTSSVQGAEGMRICTAIDSVQDFSRGPLKLSQTIHSFITKGSDVNLCGGGQEFSESIPTKLKRKPPSEPLGFSSGFGFNIKQEVKLQARDSSTESEGGEKIENGLRVAYLKNESSAETDTMDMDTLQKNHLSDVAPSIANKDINGAQATSEAFIIASINEDSRSRLPNIDLPDINQELHPIPSAASSTDTGDASTSRTQSMDVEHFLSHAEHPTNLKSSVCTDGPVELDPWSRWVKRLKPSNSDSFGHGTKISKMVEASSHEKANKLFSKMLNCSKSSSEPTMNKSFNKEHLEVDQTADFPRNFESSSTESERESREKTLSNAWIQRWCHNPPASSLKKPEAMKAYEPHRSRVMQDDFQKKQFPSIAAMALMGKAMSVFRPCEFRKRGSFVVWNMEGLR